MKTDPLNIRFPQRFISPNKAEVEVEVEAEAEAEVEAEVEAEAVSSPQMTQMTQI